MGLANWLTVARILLVPVFVSLLVYRRPGLALVTFVVAASTDLLDGWVARRRGLQSRLGAFLDPMADKLLLTASFVTLTYLKTIPFWITAVVLTRDVILVLGAFLIQLAGGRIYPQPSVLGKAATFFQVLSVLAAVGGRVLGVPFGLRQLVWVAAVTTIASGLQYIVRGMRLVNAEVTEEVRAADDLPVPR